MQCPLADEEEGELAALHCGACFGLLLLADHGVAEEDHSVATGAAEAAICNSDTLIIMATFSSLITFINNAVIEISGSHTTTTTKRGLLHDAND